MSASFKLKHFLNQHYSQKLPLLVGFSGGADSFALAHMLLSLKVPFELAHLDHSYRTDSAIEAMQLKKWAESHHIPFHHERLEAKYTKNIEDVFRQKRFEFFQKLFTTGKYEALVLAHHQNDAQETTLKRLFEGAFFTELSALKEVSVLENITVWRPLLKTSKQELLNYAGHHKLKWIEDSTNFDGSNLRSKMRIEIIPELEKSFGKNIQTNLTVLAEMSELLKDYLKKQVEKKVSISTSEFGTLVDFSKAAWHPLERLYVLKNLSAPFSRDQLLKIDELLEKSAAHKKISVKDQSAIVDRGRLYILKREPFKILRESKVKLGTQQVGSWEIQMTPSDVKLSFSNSLDNLFQNGSRFDFQVPDGEYFLKDFASQSISENVEDQKLIKIFCVKKVPKLLMPYIPQIVLKKAHDKSTKSESYLNISLICKNH